MIRTEPLPPQSPPAFIPRAALTTAADIKRRMLADLQAEPALANDDAVITREFFIARGWSRSQIEQYGAAVIEHFAEIRAQTCRR